MLEKRQTLKNEMEKIELEEEIAVAKARELMFTEEAEEEIFTETRNAKTDSDRFEHNVSVPNASNTEQRVQDVKPNIFSEEKSEVRRPELTSAVTQKIRTRSENFGTQNEISRNLPELERFGPRENHGMFEIRNRDLLLKQNYLMTVLTKQHQQSLLPDLTLTKFTGDPIEYATFMRTFESRIEARLESFSTRLRYLEQYRDKDPREVIKGCLFMEPAMGYLAAKRLLDDKYGDPYVISKAYLKRIAEWPNIKNGDDVALDRLATFLGQCVNAMTSLSHLGILEHPQNLQMLIIKLKVYLQD